MDTTRKKDEKIEREKQILKHKEGVRKRKI
jgi:hypothetical protein